MWRRLFLNPVNFCQYRNIENNTQKPHKQTVVFYDHKCPLCRTEMRKLAKLDKRGRLRQIDVSADAFDANDWGVEAAELDRALHALTPAGIWLVGMPAVRHIYSEVGLRWLMLPTRLPFVATIFDALYLRLAANRMLMSRWLGYGSAAPCRDATCSLGEPQRRNG
jgi:predicted DCC family thiol-disulfide oxidoreductase YuxK